MEEVTVKVKDSVLQQAAMEGIDTFLNAFVKAINDAIGGQLTAENMGALTTEQLTLLAWDILHREVMDGGFVQLIYNGYGPFIFANPLAKVLKMWGLRDLSKLVYDGHTLWLKYREQIERELSDEEFMALFEQLPEFDDLDDQFVDHEEEWTEQIAQYVDDHIEDFVVIEE
ncbi:MAG: DMP19 family protein [Prevotella sp.]|nr:DMP19 family protein [Prevotella sp.]